MSYLKKYASILLVAGSWVMALTACAQPVEKPAGKNAVYTYKTPDPDGIGKLYQGREIAHVMGAGGAGWLERNDRNTEENTDSAIAKLPLQPGSTVADIGAGTGYYSFRIAQRIPAGKVYAVEVQDEFVNYLNTRKKELKAGNVTVVKGSARATGLPDTSIDLAIMVDVYHELEYPQEMLQSLRRALKPQGKILLLEYRAEDPAIAIKELHKMSIAQANKEMQANGFKPVQQLGFLPIQHWLLYEKTGR